MEGFFDLRASSRDALQGRRPALALASVTFLMLPVSFAVRGPSPPALRHQGDAPPGAARLRWRGGLILVVSGRAGLRRRPRDPRICSCTATSRSPASLLRRGWIYPILAVVAGIAGMVHVQRRRSARRHRVAGSSAERYRRSALDADTRGEDSATPLACRAWHLRLSCRIDGGAAPREGRQYVALLMREQGGRAIPATLASRAGGRHFRCHFSVRARSRLSCALPPA